MQNAIHIQQRALTHVDASPAQRSQSYLCTSMNIHACVYVSIMFAFQRHCEFRTSPHVVVQRYSMVGPTFAAMRGFCSRVYSVATDMGTERNFARYRDMLPDFFRLIGAPIPANAEKCEYMFPRALQISGWRHNFDVVLRRMLNQFKFWPSWIDKLKAVHHRLPNPSI